MAAMGSGRCGARRCEWCVRLAVRALLKQLGDPGSRKAVAAALEQVTGQKLGDDPKAWRSWWEQKRPKAR